MKQKTNKLYLQFGKYFVSGGAYFWSGYAVFALFYSGLGVGVGVSKIAGSIVGLSVNFILLRWWAFRSGDRKQELPTSSGRYIVLTIINLLIDYGIVVGLAGYGLTPYIGQFVSAGFFTVWNFVWYKLWVFAPINPSTGDKL